MFAIGGRGGVSVKGGGGGGEELREERRGRRDLYLD